MFLQNAFEVQLVLLFIIILDCDTGFQSTSSTDNMHYSIQNSAHLKIFIICNIYFKFLTVSNVVVKK